MRVILADDSVIFREGLCRLLREHDFDVVAQVGRPDDLLAAVPDAQPDVVVIDIRMPPTHTDEGLVAAQHLRERHPDVGVVVLSQYVEPRYAIRLLEQGERGVGYLLKDRVLDVGDLAGAIRRVADGESVVDPALVEQLVDRPRRADEPIASLTVREREVLALMAEGLTDRGIAERLYVTTKTVETHVRHIFLKLELPYGAASNRRVHAVLVHLRS